MKQVASGIPIRANRDIQVGNISWKENDTIPVNFLTHDLIEAIKKQYVIIDTDEFRALVSSNDPNALDNYLLSLRGDDSIEIVKQYNTPIDQTVIAVVDEHGNLVIPDVEPNPDEDGAVYDLLQVATYFPVKALRDVTVGRLSWKEDETQKVMFFTDELKDAVKKGHLTIETEAFAEIDPEDDEAIEDYLDSLTGYGAIEKIQRYISPVVGTEILSGPEEEEPDVPPVETGNYITAADGVRITAANGVYITWSV